VSHTEELHLSISNPYPGLTVLAITGRMYLVVTPLLIYGTVEESAWGTNVSMC
jgi:hypothetical protein